MNWNSTVRNKGGFTLIEMLVVISMMALLSGMIITLFEDSAEDALTKSAIELKTVLDRARSLAIKSGRMHAVTFHVENAGDGRVMKNGSDVDDADFPGRHWYAIIGPDFSAGATYGGHKRSKDKIPVGVEGQGFRQISFYSLADYIEVMKDVQVGPKHYLLPGVRFLALGDEDKLYGSYSHPTYPRPWFGFYDDTTGTLHPWGAYEPDIDAGFSKPSTGLDYQGEDGPLDYYAPWDTIVNPAAVWGRIHPGATAASPTDLTREYKASAYYRGVTENGKGPDTTYLASTATRKVVRPLLNGYWGDFMIVYDAKGSARFTYGEARHIHFRGTAWNDHNGGRSDMRVNNEIEHTGGLAITLCRDVDDSDTFYSNINATTGSLNYNKFNSVEEAFESITPFKRVFVWRQTGFSEIRGMQHPANRIMADDLLQKDPYPHGYGK